MSIELPPLPKPKHIARLYTDGSFFNSYTADQMRSYAAKCVAAERERCAKLCESLFDLDDDSCDEAELCAAAIRAGSPEEAA